MNKRIAVLLASYNGTKYIKVQLDSILNQKEVDATIFQILIIYLWLIKMIFGMKIN
ncbi:hypothetical protein N5U55_07795 [Aliarcobacter butzleri]|uniref:hypothetical protein n=1 Tax=Aliarcobacter butzleri TaxID=28197 RepID=UPI0021B1D05B|nr:hypothetical protein [Aliarcobacter butzleri]MCT7584012.1 hypothetical protein [Aliarcobacter butzleri]